MLASAIPESQFTAPRADCPHPERWHAPDPDTTEVEVSELVAGMVRALQPDLVVETGTAFGYTTVAIADALLANGHGRCVSLEVDPQRVSDALMLLARTFGSDCAGVVSVVQQSSLEWTPPGPIGFAWLDSLFDLRPAEYDRYRPWFRPGTVVGFHDTGPHYPVRARVEALAARDRLGLIHLPTPRGVSFVTVP